MAESELSKEELEMKAAETAAEGLEDLIDAADTLEVAEDVAELETAPDAEPRTKPPHR